MFNLQLKKDVINISLDLKDFEKKYNLSSKEFYQRYTQGQSDDSEDAILWAGLCEMLRDNESRLREMMRS